MKRIFQIIRAVKALLLMGLLAMASLFAGAQVAENDFSYNLGGTGFNGAVNASALQADGKLIVGGAFTSFNGKVNSSGSVVTTTRNYIARLNTDGTLDNTFDPGTGLGAAVLSLAIQPSDGKIVVAGSFAAGVARLNTTGTVDGTFALTGTGLNGYVQMVTLQADEKMIIGGTFTTYNTSTTRNRIARLNTVGTLDVGFDPGTGLNGLPRACAIQSDGKIIVVGGSSGFSTYNGTSRDNIVRIESNGAIDNTFTPPASLFAYLFDVKIQSDGKSVITGRYNGNINSIFNGVARLNTTGAIDNTFTSSFFTGGLALAIQSDGKIVIGGIGFGTSGLAQGIRRLTTAGASDSFMVGPSKGFEPPADSEIRTIAIQSDGRIIAGGTGFTSFNGIGRATIARITTCSSVSITTQPASATTCATNNATFAVVASGTGLTYKWQVNSAALGVGLYTDITDAGVYTGATTNTLTITNATIGLNQYYYRCLVTDASCTSTSNVALLTVNALPVINTQPLPSMVCENADATFTIAATNPASYQWQQDTGSGFVNVTTNGNSATLTLVGVLASFNGHKYRCVLGSCSPAIISSEVVLTVNTSPIITTQPLAAIICTGGNAQFSVIATNASTYQWQEKIGAGAFANITNGGIYGGATTNSLVLTGATTTQNSNQYRCIITGANTCTSTSAAVFLNVYATPVISTHPANSTKCAASNTTFTVAVTSPPAGLTYQWQEKVGSGSFTNLTNGGVYSTVSAATLTLTGVTAGMNGNKYRCVVGACATPVVSFEADLIVDSPPVITLQPLASAICAGMATTFTTNASGLGVTFQWQKNTGSGSGTFNNVVNGGIYSGATTEALTLTNVSIGETNFHYRCVITASGICTGVNTSGALLTVRAVPEFSTQPVNKTVCEGLTTSFSTSVIFSGAPNYQWQVSEAASAFTDLTANVSLYPNGVNSASLAVSPTFSMNGNKYRVRVGDCQPLVFSNEVTLTVNQAPAITAQPINNTICKGETATFSVTATGSDLTYQWVGPIGGSNTSTLTLNNVPPSLTGSKIYCIVKGATGCAQVQSTEATLTVNNLVITTQPTAVNPFCPGGNVSYSIVGEGASLTYQWQEDNKSGTFTDITNGGMYAGATTNKLDLTSVPFTMSGFRYRCLVKGLCGELNSSAVNLSLSPTPAKPVINVNTSNPESPVLTAPNGDGFKWYKNGALVSSSSSLSVTSEGSYTVIVSLNGCASVVSDPAAIVITGDQESLLKSPVQVYPNPSSNHITLLLGGFEKDKPVSISIVDMQGRVMEKTSGLGQREISIDIRNYTTGKYIAWLQQRTTKVARQFIKNDK